MTKTEELLRGTMLSEAGMLRDLQDLSLYYEDMTVQSRVIPVMELAPLPTLISMMEEDEKGRNRVIVHSFLPMDKESAEFTKYLQLYTELQNSLEGIDRMTLLEALCKINAMLPFGVCILTEPRPELGLPLMAAVRALQGFHCDQPIDQGVFTGDVFLFDASCEMVSGLLDALAEGNSLENALEILKQ